MLTGATGRYEELTGAVGWEISESSVQVDEEPRRAETLPSPHGVAPAAVISPQAGTGIRILGYELARSAQQKGDRTGDEGSYLAC